MPDQSSRKTNMKTVDNPQYSEYDTENMQATMTLKRNKKEEILKKHSMTNIQKWMI